MYHGRMRLADNKTIRIAAAIIEDHRGRLLFVRKSGTEIFMQAGGKIEPHETALCALRRELDEEIGLSCSYDTHYLGQYSAEAANEPDHFVTADLFYIRIDHQPVIRAEIAEVVWRSCAEAEDLLLAPLSRDYVLPIARAFNDGQIIVGAAAG